MAGLYASPDSVRYTENSRCSYSDPDPIREGIRNLSNRGGDCAAVFLLLSLGAQPGCEESFCARGNEHGAAILDYNSSRHALVGGRCSGTHFRPGLQAQHRQPNIDSIEQPCGVLESGIGGPKGGGGTDEAAGG